MCAPEWRSATRGAAADPPPVFTGKIQAHLSQKTKVILSYKHYFVKKILFHFRIKEPVRSARHRRRGSCGAHRAPRCGRNGGRGASSAGCPTSRGRKAATRASRRTRAA